MKKLVLLFVGVSFSLACGPAGSSGSNSAGFEDKCKCGEQDAVLTI